MTKTITISILAGLLMVGCGDDIFSGGTGGFGGGGQVIGPLQWDVSQYTVTEDACQALELDPAEPPLTFFEVTIDGSTLTFDSNDLLQFRMDVDIPVGGTSNAYSPTASTVITTEMYQDSVDACTVDQTDTFTITTADPTLSLDQNATATVVWEHRETESAATPGACGGVWIVPLPCTSRATFTLTQNPAPIAPVTP